MDRVDRASSNMLVGSPFGDGQQAQMQRVQRSLVVGWCLGWWWAED
jgi:hypothetical protein